jgi:hypothetical protein
MPSPPSAPQFVITQDAPTKIRGRALELKAGKWARFPGGPFGRHRRQIVITNDDNSNDNLYIMRCADEATDPDTATEPIMAVFPQTSITLFTNDLILIKNLHATDTVTAVYVLETFYV